METDERNPISFSPSLVEEYPPQNLKSLTLPLQIISSFCSSASLLLLLTSLCMSYWLTENPPQGLLHTGLWGFCINHKCTLYGFHKIAMFIHVMRGFLLAATVFSIVSLSFICISFQRTRLGILPMIPTAAVLSFIAGLYTLVSMSVFTVMYKNAEPQIPQLSRYGSSYTVGWASCIMFFLTGCLLLLTKSTLEP